MIRPEAYRLGAGLAAVTAVSVVLRALHVANAGTISTTYLTVVLFVATTCRLRVAVVTDDSTARPVMRESRSCCAR